MMFMRPPKGMCVFPWRRLPPPGHWQWGNHPKIPMFLKICQRRPQTLSQPRQRLILLMVQKSGKLTSWGKGSWNPIIYQGLYKVLAPSQVVGNGISAIKKYHELGFPPQSLVVDEDDSLEQSTLRSSVHDPIIWKIISTCNQLWL